MEILTRNSIYHLDLASKTVTGGIFRGDTKQYTKVEYQLGCPAVFFMADGDVVMTSAVNKINVA